MDRIGTTARTAGAIALVATLTGCVERRLFITSDPPGALVHLNDVEVGRTPLEVDFVYFGTYDVRVEKQGYEPLLTSAKVAPKFHDLPGPDLIAEAWPGRFRTHKSWHFTLEEAETDPDALMARAAALRTRLGGSTGTDVDRLGEAPAQEPIVIDELSEIQDPDRPRPDERPQPPGEEPPRR